MCQLKSAIVLKDRVFMPDDYNEHERMIEELKLNDKTKEPDFVRVEVSPTKNPSEPLDKWVYKVDQDFLPEWYSAKFAEKETREALEKWADKRILKDVKGITIKEGFYVLLGSSSAKLWGSSSAKLCDSSSAKLYDSSSAELWGSSSAKLCDSSSAKLWGSSSAELWRSSSAELYDSSSAIILPNYTKEVKIKAIKDLAIVKDLRVNKIYTADKTLKQEVFKTK